jgi:capsid protein
LAAWFQEALGVSGLDAAEPEIPLWTAPARVLVDATREIPAIKDAVRAGLMSLPEAIRQQGYDPETLITEHADFLQRLDALGVQLDTDPRADKAAPEKVTHADDENAPDPDTPRPH